MEDNFTLQIISPEKILFSESVKMVTIPSYEGDMSILKNHISIISFLRPGRVKIKKNDFSGLIISNLNCSLIKLLRLLPFFQLFL